MKTVKTFSGKEIKIKDYQKSLRVDFPSYCQKNISDNGEPFLSNCIESDTKCGCKIIGNGTLQFPLSIQFCDNHK